MTQSYWQQYYDEEVYVGARKHYAHRRLPTDTDCDAFEQQTGFKLPTDYREFIKVFGPGQFCGILEILSPGFPDTRSMDLLTWNVNAKRGYTSERARKDFSDLERVARIVYFISTSSANHIGWDPEDVRDEQTHEYGIYGTRDYEVEEVAGSFRKFIQDFCLGQGVYQWMNIADVPEFDDEPDENGELVPTRNFVPQIELKDWRPS